MKIGYSLIVIITFLLACQSSSEKQKEKTEGMDNVKTREELAQQVKEETLRSWKGYKQHAWGYDVLLPLSKKGFNWYDETLGISPYDAYSTLKVMGFDEEAHEIEQYALKENWDKDVYVQVFEVNIRILGGLLAMYEYTRNPNILEKVRDFGDRILPAFDSPTGIPYHSINLHTGKTAGNKGEGKGDIINVAQAATYLFEFGILSYYTEDPKYYQAAKRATKAIFERKSEIGLPGEHINVETGEWIGTQWHHLQAGVDAYYEYMYKSWMIFPDPEIREIWDYSSAKINEYLLDEYEGRAYYTIVDMHTGEILKRSVSLYDAFFPAIQAVSGQIDAAEKNQQTWDWLWDKYGLLPTRYHYGADTVEYANSELNPEIIESAYYLHQITGKAEYLDMITKYWVDINTCCRSEVAYHSIKDVRTMEENDYLATYFFAETLKYFYIAFAGKDIFDFDQHVFNTEAHTFRKDSFDPELAKTRLGY
ncbi:glycoside hydrolase family 47 [Fulvivirga sp. M361]|uniref:glycoside hydrolase family 47 protein n=1 Tax=Fulvivirga sp. M361 TaxID=2594266 RepID=UPI00117A9AAE|nr:glycoside hydrolase family 47 protein [Fulvivirga sp. M361]TRX50035.1 glycoside hydrolase family 47 [Fulvivirga sp. M361]